ncbi:MAG: hypothetical protein Q9221_003639 [Calogaya cf. arnoldii]
MVYRAVKVIQYLYYMVLRRSSRFSVEKVDRVDEDTMFVHRGLGNPGDNWRLGVVRAGACSGTDQELAALTVNNCTNAVIAIGPSIETMLKDCISFIFECQTVALNRKLWAVTVSPDGSIDSEGTGSNSNYINNVDGHEVFLIMIHGPGAELHDFERYAVDLTHAQYGHHDETLIPWKTHVETRVKSNQGVLPLGRAREKRKEMFLQGWGNEGREILIFLEKFERALTAAVQDYPGPGWTKIWKEQNETSYQRQADRVFQHVAHRIDQMVAAEENKASFKQWRSMAEKKRLEANAEAIRKHKLDFWGHDLRGSRFVSAMKVMKARQAKERGN